MCPRGCKQGYDAQAVVTAEKIVIAAEINADSPDFGHLEPMMVRLAGSYARSGYSTSPTSWSRTPATGTTNRWTVWPPRGSRC